MRIRRRKNKGGSVSWQLDCGVIDGRRVQLSFPTEGDAKEERNERQQRLRQYGEAAYTLTEDERIRFQAARDQLAAVGATIEKAVAHYLTNAPKLKAALTLPKLFKLWIDEQEALQARPRYVTQLRSSCGSFIAGREDQLATEVTRDQVKAWILGNGWAAKTQKNYLGDLHAFYAWAIRERYVAENPCRDIPLAAQEDSEIQIFGATECERLLITAATWRGKTWNRKTQRYDVSYRYRPLLGYAAIATFAGVRPEELQSTKRSEIDQEHCSVLVMGDRAKTRKRRVVDLPACAMGWIQIWNEQCPGDWIIPKNFQRLWSALRAAAKLMPWPHDVLRHTCASMHYMLHQDEGRVKALLGHSKGEDTFLRHYRGLRLPNGKPINRAEAERFYRIVRPGLIPEAV